MAKALIDSGGLDETLAACLAQEPCLQPLAEDPADITQYGHFELADAVSVRCAAHVDPDELQDPELRAQWTARVLDGETLDGPFESGRRPYWIVDQGERIGTIAFAAVPEPSAPTIEISSVYLRPKHRRRGWASRVLRTLKDNAFASGFQRTMLEVEWNNQDALRFYCAQGMWVAGWKNTIELYHAQDQPHWQLETHDGEARFKVKGRVAAVAHNHGAKLDWVVKKSTDKHLRDPLEQTAAVQLALMRWPIIRSDKLWQEQIRKGWSDGGPLEGFALRLRQLERHIRRKGWNLPAERNPSFASLPILREVTSHDHLLVHLSEGPPLVVPFDALGLPANASDTLLGAQILGDEVICTLSTGQPVIISIDYLLYLTQSPDHLARAAQLAREARSRS